MTTKMAKRALVTIALGAAAALAGCGGAGTGPIQASAIGAPPQLLNPNLRNLDPPAAMLAEASAQGLVRFDAAGEIEPALAQSWIVSDDGLRYTFRIRRTQWADGSRVTAEQVAGRLRAAISRASRNPLKPVLGVVDEITAMTDEVLEISLKGPRPYLLQLLAQPEMTIALNGSGTGPYRREGIEEGVLRLAVPRPEEEGAEDDDRPRVPDILLRGDSAAFAVARFAAGEADYVSGGTIGNLAYARAADLPGSRLVFDPAVGLFGLAFEAREGPIENPDVRRALAMAVDRDALAEALGAPGLQARAALVPPGLDELPQPAAPDWVG